MRRFTVGDSDEDIDDREPGKARALTREELDAFLLIVDPQWRLLFELLAATGLRISETLLSVYAHLLDDGAHRAAPCAVTGPVTLTGECSA